MRRPPRSADEGIFSDGMGFDIALQGVIVTILTLASYFIGQRMSIDALMPADSAVGSTMAFLTLSLVEIFHAYNMRSRRASIFSIRWQNKWLWGAMAVSFVLSIAVVALPFLRPAFGFAALTFEQFIIAFVLALLIIPIVELVKLLKRRLGKN